MANERKLELKIVADPSQASKGIRKVSDDAAKMGKELEAQGTKIRDGLGKAGLAVAGLTVVGLTGAYRAAAESQKIARVTEAVIKSTGGAAGLTAEQVGDLATKYSELTGVDDELIQSSSNVLLTFTKVRNEIGKGNDVFDRAQMAALDLSTVLGGDLQGATVMLGKALNDPVKGLTALGRAGVQFSAEQKAAIKNFAETGDILSAQKIILQEVETQVGGAAEAAATDADRAKVALGNLQESIGAAFLPAVEAGARGIGALAEGISGLPDPVKVATGTVLALGGAALYLTPKIVDGASAIKKLVDNAKAVSGGNGLRGLTQGLSGISSGMGIAGIATVGASAMLYAWADEARKDAKDAANLASEVENLRSVMKDQGQTAAEAARAMAPEKYAQFADQYREMGLTVEQFVDVLSMSDQEVKALFDRNLINPDSVDDAEAIKALDEYRKAVAEADRQTTEAAAATEALAEGNTNLADSSADSAEAAKELAGEIKDIADKADKATSKLKELYGLETSTLEGRLKANEALAAFNEGLKDNGRTLDENSEKGQSNLENLIAFKDAAVDSANAVFEQKHSAEDAANTLTAYAMRLADTAKSAGYTDDEVAGLLDTLGLTPEEITTNFKTAGVNKVSAEADTVRTKAEAAAKARTVRINAQTSAARTEMDRFKSVADNAARDRRSTVRAQGSGISEVNSALDNAARPRTTTIFGSLSQGLQDAIARLNAAGGTTGGGHRNANGKPMPNAISLNDAVAPRAMPNTSAVSGDVVHITVQGSVLSERELIGLLRDAKRRGATAGLF